MRGWPYIFLWDCTIMPGVLDKILREYEPLPTHTRTPPSSRWDELWEELWMKRRRLP